MLNQQQCVQVTGLRRLSQARISLRTITSTQFPLRFTVLMYLLITGQQLTIRARTLLQLSEVRVLPYICFFQKQQKAELQLQKSMVIL
jgi:hypothetical protein